MAKITTWNTILEDNFHDHSQSFKKDIQSNGSYGFITEGCYVVDIPAGTNGDWWGGATENSPILYYSPLLGSNSERYTTKIVAFNSGSTGTTVSAGITIYTSRNNAYLYHVASKVLYWQSILADVGAAIGNTAVLPIFWDTNATPLLLRVTYTIATTTLVFEHSTDDGQNWTTDYTIAGASFTPTKCGMFVKNWGVYPVIRAAFEYFKVENNSSGGWVTTTLETFAGDTHPPTNFTKDFPIAANEVRPRNRLGFFNNFLVLSNLANGTAVDKTSPIAYWELTQSTGLYKAQCKLTTLYAKVLEPLDNSTAGMIAYQDRNNFYLFDYRYSGNQSTRTLNVYRVVANGAGTTLAQIVPRLPMGITAPVAGGSIGFSSDPIYLIIKYNIDTNFISFSYARDDYNSCIPMYSNASASFRPTRVGMMQKSFGSPSPSPPDTISFYDYFTIQKWDEVEVIPQIGGDFTINKYIHLPYEHGQGRGECVNIDKVVPYFLGPRGVNYRHRSIVNSSSLGGSSPISSSFG
jgi:hypothetical protein